MLKSFFILTGEGRDVNPKKETESKGVSGNLKIGRKA
jgi:hypothetical protein